MLRLAPLVLVAACGGLTPAYPTGTCPTGTCAGTGAGTGSGTGAGGGTTAANENCSNDEDDDGDGYVDEGRGGDDCDDGSDSVYPGATETCGDSVDSDCDGLDCADFFEGFESGAVGTPWVLGGTSGMVAGATPYAGSWSAQNSVISHNQTSCMAVDLTYAAGGDVSFWHSGSTESCCDYLRFYIDGVEQGQWAGAWAWTSATYPVATGTHNLAWCYTKDVSVNTGADAVYVDDVRATGGAP